MLFNERQQIFKLAPASKAARVAGEFSERLRASLKKESPIRVTLNPGGGFIQEVADPAPGEIDEFLGRRVLLDKPDKGVTIDVASIDPTKFNLVDYYLKFPPFRLCTRIVPDYTTAKAIFDFCAKQSCHWPGPYDISPCIPFQYVRDGCYARAHKMRWIITTKYRYCCEKVFSFANQDDDRLAVKADKWGGCCVRRKAAIISSPDDRGADQGT